MLFYTPLFSKITLYFQITVEVHNEYHKWIKAQQWSKSTGPDLDGYYALKNELSGTLLTATNTAESGNQNLNLIITGKSLRF